MSNRFTVPTRINTPIKSSNITVIILASGFRAGQNNIYEPSILFKTKRGKNALDENISAIKQVLPDSDIVISTGYCSEKVEEKIPKFCRSVENQIFDITNECEDLRLSLKCCITDYALIISDSFLFDYEVLAGFLSTEASILVTDDKKFRTNVRAVVNNDCVESISYGLNSEPKLIGMYFMSPKEISVLKKIVDKRENKHKMLFEITNDMLDEKCKFKANFVGKGKVEKI